MTQIFHSTDPTEVTEVTEVAKDAPQPRKAKVLVLRTVELRKANTGTGPVLDCDFELELPLPTRAL